MFGLSKYALIAALCAVIALGGWLMLERGRNAVLAAENERLSASLATCSARVTNIKEDMRDDATVDDPRLFDVPSEWLRPDAPGD